MSHVTDKLFIDALAAKGVKLNEDPYGGNVRESSLNVYAIPFDPEYRSMGHGSVLRALIGPKSGPGLIQLQPTTSPTRTIQSLRQAKLM